MTIRTNPLKTNPSFSAQDRADLAAYKESIPRHLREIDLGTVAAVALGQDLCAVQDRGLYRIDANPKFYRWVHQHFKVKKTQAAVYVALGRSLTPQQVTGLALSVRTLYPIAQVADAELRQLLLDLARENLSSAALTAARVAGERAPDGERLAAARRAAAQPIVAQKDPLAELLRCLQRAERLAEQIHEQSPQTSRLEEMRRSFAALRAELESGATPIPPPQVHQLAAPESGAPDSGQSPQSPPALKTLLREFVSPLEIRRSLR